MNSSVSPKDEIWFLRVCHHISNASYCLLLTTELNVPHLKGAFTSMPEGIFTTDNTFFDHTPDSTGTGVSHQLIHVVCDFHMKNLTERFLNQQGADICLLMQTHLKFVNSATGRIPSRRAVAQWLPSAGPRTTLLCCPFLVPRHLGATVTNTVQMKVQLKLAAAYLAPARSSLESVLTEVLSQGIAILIEGYLKRTHND